jgi:predicted DNA-binding transcriptional regulator AlpA
MTLDERIAIAEEAARLEAAGADWEVKHVAAVLGCSRSTIYDTYWLTKIARRVGRSRVRWNPREVREAQRAESEKRDRRRFDRSRRRTA